MEIDLNIYMKIMVYLVVYLVITYILVNEYYFKLNFVRLLLGNII